MAAAAGRTATTRREDRGATPAQPRSVNRSPGLDPAAPAAAIQLVRHGPLRLRLRLRLADLTQLFDAHSSWARGRSRRQLRRMLSGSQVVISAWQQGRLVGFGRASSDGVFRAVLWDVVVAEPLRGQGIGRRLVGALLSSPPLSQCERVYLMTTSSRGFYQHLGFQHDHGQQLLVWRREPCPDRSSA